jgi:hypothetical protein
MAIHLLTKQHGNFRTACGVAVAELIGNIGSTLSGTEVLVAYKGQRFDCPRCRQVAKRQPELTRSLWVEAAKNPNGAA